MKPEVPRATAPAAAPIAETKNQPPSQSHGENPSSLPPSAGQRRLPSVLVVMLVVYGLWLGWLAYVALINVRAGNQ